MRRGPWVLWGIVMLLLAVTIWMGIQNDSFGQDPFFLPLAISMVIGYVTIGALIASKTRRNAIAWLLVGVGVPFLIGGSSAEYVELAFARGAEEAPFTSFAAWLTNWSFMLVIIPVPWILLLFPTGSLPSPRWRWVARALVVVSVGVVCAAVLNPAPILVNEEIPLANPTGVAALRDVIQVVLPLGGVALLALGFLCAIALVLRYRRSSGEQRQQMRWFVAAVVLAVALVLAAILTALAEAEVVNEIVFFAFFVVLGVAVPAACAVAVLRYRLYDLDVVVKKTVLYASVALLLIVMYLVAAGVLGGAMIDAPAAAIIAWFLIGVAFWPAMRVARRLADRIVYGGRATPYEVLTDFSQRVSESYAAEDVLPRMARIVGEAVGATEAIVWLRVGSDLRLAGRYPSDGPDRPNVAVRDDALPELPGDAAIEVRDQGDLLGALTLTMPANDPMDVSKERLVRDLAAQAGLVLRNVRLIEELRASRQRLVAAQDAERRRLERNIHDGVQQHLVALTVKLRLLEQIGARDPAKAAELAGQLQLQTTDALEELRDLARGIYPPLLADQGLAAALSAQARKLPWPVAVDADGIGRYPQDVEAAVYFSCLEALNNIAKYAEASRVTISLTRDDHRLAFRVADDGVGFDPRAARRGTGLQGIEDRIDALGGRVEIHSRPGAGTTVAGSIPVGSS